MEVRPTAITDISEVPGCHLLQQMSPQWRSEKLLQGLVFHELTAYLSVFNLLKLNELWPYYQKHVNQTILNRTTLWSLALRIFEAFVRILLIVNLSLNQTLLTFLLCETNLDDSIDSGNLSVRGYLPLIQKDSGTHMQGLAVYVKEGLPFAWDWSLENSADSYLCFQLALLHSVSLLLLSLSITFFIFLHSFWFCVT